MIKNAAKLVLATGYPNQVCTPFAAVCLPGGGDQLCAVCFLQSHTTPLAFLGKKC